MNIHCYDQVKAILLVWEDGFLLGTVEDSPIIVPGEAQHPPAASPQIRKQAKNSETLDKAFLIFCF